jgi:membrane dipeptidase
VGRERIFDLHCDAVLRLVEGRDLGRRGDGQFDLVRAKSGGLGAVFLAGWVDPRSLPGGAAARTLALLAELHRFVGANRARIGIALSAGDVERVTRSGRIAAMLAIEGGHALEGDLRLLEMYAALGVRSVTLTWANSNEWADASTDPVVARGGLSAFGRDVVRAMNRLGMVVDLAHVSCGTFADALDATRRPVLVTHAGARALCDHPRNVDDGQLRALARNGGMVGICAYPPFLSSGRPEDVGVDDVLDHVDHAVGVAGIDHVGFGSDFEGITLVPKGLEDVSRLQILARGLASRGYADHEIRKILWTNALRVVRSSIGR